MIDAPDFPSLDPTPSIAAFPFSLHSFERGTNASSFVASKNVYLEALAKQFCIDPKKTPNASGVVLNKAVKAASPVSLKRRKEKKAIPVVRSIRGQIIALLVQLSFLSNVEIKTLTTAATMPTHVTTFPKCALKSFGFG